MRRAVGLGATGSLIALGTGLAIMAGGTIAYGDWWLIRRPWSDLGMDLIAIGIGGSLLFLGAATIVEPVGRWRLLALPGIVLGGLTWSFLAFIGLPTGGACCEQPVPNLVTGLYSAPQSILILVAAVAVTGLPLVLTRPWARAPR
jgi:hypothetical protein